MGLTSEHWSLFAEIQPRHTYYKLFSMLTQDDRVAMLRGLRLAWACNCNPLWVKKEFPSLDIAVRVEPTVRVHPK